MYSRLKLHATTQNVAHIRGESGVDVGKGIVVPGCSLLSGRRAGIQEMKRLSDDREKQKLRIERKVVQADGKGDVRVDKA